MSSFIVKQSCHSLGLRTNKENPNIHPQFIIHHCLQFISLLMNHPISIISHLIDLHKIQFSMALFRYPRSPPLPLRRSSTTLPSFLIPTIETRYRIIKAHLQIGIRLQDISHTPLILKYILGPKHSIRVRNIHHRLMNFTIGQMNNGPPQHPNFSHRRYNILLQTLIS